MDIWDEIRQDRERGARRLVADYGDRLLAAAYLLCANAHDAEDLVFRTFERAVRKIAQYDAAYSFYTWLHTIMLNFRRMDVRRRRPKILLSGAPQDLPDAADAGVSAPGEAGDAVAQALRALSPSLREAAVMRYFAEKSVEEMAAELGVPVGTVKSRLHNARKALQRLLRPLPQDFADKLGRRVARTHRLRWLGAWALSAMLLGAGLAVAWAVRGDGSRDVCDGAAPALRADGAPTPGAKVGPWWLVGFLRECLTRTRAPRRREDGDLAEETETSKTDETKGETE